MIVRVPASSANLGPGFDTLGMALSLHLEVGVEPLPESFGTAEGERHPAVAAFRSLGGTGSLFVRSPIPMGRGLGFSGAARVAGLVAAVAQRDGEFDLHDHGAEILAAAVQLEGHADNAAASLFGGVVATDGVHTVRVPMQFEPAVVCWVPFNETSTNESRARLPDTVPIQDVVFNLARTAMLVAAFAAGDTEVLHEATQDRLHQDVRFAQSPESRAALDAMLNLGAWCGWLSGSGPTVAALCAPGEAEAVAAALPSHNAAIKVLRIDHAGAVCEDA
ncbi:MAG: thrB [Acidimicrobiia bacterium]|nr:thrB [Acidimicrobiia bacterium]